MILAVILAAISAAALHFLIPVARRDGTLRDRINALNPRRECLLAAGLALVSAAFTLFLPAGNTLSTLPTAVAIAIAAVIAVHDIRTMKIPDILLIILLICAGIRAWSTGVLTDHALVFAIAAGILLPAAFLFAGLIGTGDFKYLAVIAAFLGFPFIIVAAETALISACIIGIGYGLITRKGLRIRIPFGPFISLGFLAALIWGTAILDRYYELFP